MVHLRNSIIFLMVAALLAAGFFAPNERAAAELAIPDTLAGGQLSWALDQVNTAADGTTDTVIAEHFSDAYLAVVTPAQLIGYFRDYINPAGPMTVARFEGGATELRTNAILQGPYGYWRVELGVTPNAPHKIDTMWFEPIWTTTTPGAAPRSWSDLKRDLSVIAPFVSVSIAELDEGECLPIARVEPDQVLPIASSFKLYVLGELARQVSEQQAGWLELLPISTRYISQPNGEMRNLPVGSEYTLAHFAEQMISQSDNTATDHLIGRLGREQVEAAFAEMGQADPTVNVPLMLTREWFALRMRFTDEQIVEFLSLDDAGRLAFLQDVANPVADTILETELWPGSRWASEVEWFASAGDLCRALAYLQDRGEQPGMEPVLNALSLAPEIVFDPEVWSYVGYKGGYETGVMSENFLLQRASDGRWFSISAVIYDPNWEINGFGLRDLLVQAAQMLAFEE
jgi:hypothetical protein